MQSGSICPQLLNARAKESAAYHEAGHAVVAAILKMPIKRYGIHVDGDGKGICYYHPPRHFQSHLGAEERPETIRDGKNVVIALFAGLTAQRKFYRNSSGRSASRDEEQANELLNHMYWNETDESKGIKTDELRERTRSIVTEYWDAVEAVAREVWAAPWSDRTDEENPSWSDTKLERRIDGETVTQILRGRGIDAKSFEVYAD